MKSSSSTTRNDATRKLRALAKEVAMRRKKKALVATVRATVAFATGSVATATAAADAVQRVMQSTSSWTDAGSGKRRDETRELRALAKRSRRASKRKVKMRRGLRRSVRVMPRRDGVRRSERQAARDESREESQGDSSQTATAGAVWPIDYG